MKTISLKLSDSLAVQITRAARKKNRTKSAVIREVLENYLNSTSSPGSGSCLEQAADLAGCLRAPGDLSCNKKYFRGFGQ